MNRAARQMRDFAERLISFEANGNKSANPSVVLIFEKLRPHLTTMMGISGFRTFLSRSLVLAQEKVRWLRAVHVKSDGSLEGLKELQAQVGAKRLVIDSLVGFEMALAPDFRADFRESLYRMIGALTGAGITILSTVEVEDTFTEMSFSHYAISFLTDDIIRLRYVEIDGQLRKVMVVVKTRGGNHSKDIREYIITEKGMVVIHPRRTDYLGLITGVPQRTGPRKAQENEAAPEPKATK